MAARNPRLIRYRKIEERRTPWPRSSMLTAPQPADAGVPMQSKPHFPALPLLLIVIMASGCVNANSQTCAYVVSPNQELRIAALPPVVAASTSDFAVMKASIATAVLDPNVCCGRNSALGDQVVSARGASLRDLGGKLRGKHYLDNGTSIFVADQYWPAAPIEQNSVKAGDIITSLLAQRPLLMNWDGHLYVVYGAIYDVCAAGSPDYPSYGNFPAIRTLLLVDTRFSDRRRYVSFNRQTNDWGKVTGFLALAITHNK